MFTLVIKFFILFSFVRKSLGKLDFANSSRSKYASTVYEHLKILTDGLSIKLSDQQQKSNSQSYEL